MRKRKNVRIFPSGMIHLCLLSGNSGVNSLCQRRHSLHNSAICLEYLALTSVHKLLFSFLQLMDQKVQGHNKAAGSLHEFLYGLENNPS